MLKGPASVVWPWPRPLQHTGVAQPGQVWAWPAALLCGPLMPSGTLPPRALHLGQAQLGRALGLVGVLLLLLPWPGLGLLVGLGLLRVLMRAGGW